MGKKSTTIIDRFNGGMAKDVRSGNSNQYAITHHFNTHDFPGKLKPYRATEADESKAFGLKRFTTGDRAGTQVLWGLGASGSNAAIYYHSITPETDSWSTPANNTTTGNVNYDMFIHYRDRLYGCQTNGNLWQYNTDAATMDDSYGTLGSVTTAQGVVHPADDILYLFEDNFVHKIDGTTLTQDILTLPQDMIIKAATAYGNYLAIGIQPTGDGFYSRPCEVYLWDRDSSLTTITHKIEFGTGQLKALATIQGNLVAVMDRFTNSPEDYDDAAVVIRVANQSMAEAITVNEIPSEGSINVVSNFRSQFVDDNRLYFPARVTLDGVDRTGIWSTDVQGRTTLEFVEEDLTTSGTSPIDGIIKVANAWFIAHSGDGSVNKTNDTASYTYTSIYESLKFSNPDRSKTMKLIGATVMTAPMPAAGQVVLKFKTDEDSSWTTIFTNTTDNSTRQSAIKDSSGTGFPEYREIQFRIESTGGAEITGLKFFEEEIDDDIYNEL